MCPGRTDVARREVDELPFEPVTDRTPEVLLDQPVRQELDRFTLVVRACQARGKGVDERRQRLRLGQVRLRVADADLDRRIREMRTNAPPDLRVLVDRAGVVEEANVLLEAAPPVVRVRNAAARKRAREDLGPRGVQSR